MARWEEEVGTENELGDFILLWLNLGGPTCTSKRQLLKSETLP